VLRHGRCHSGAGRNPGFVHYDFVSLLDMPEMLIKNLVWFLGIATLAVAYALPCLYVYQKGHLIGGVLYSMMAQILWYFLIYSVVHGLLIFSFPGHQEIIDANYNKAGPVVAAYSGWLPALIFCGIAKFAHSRNQIHLD
jgi:hypothetical protein